METIPRPSRRSSEVRRIRCGVGDLPCPRHRGPRGWGIEASDRQTRFSTLELTGVLKKPLCKVDVAVQQVGDDAPLIAHRSS